MKATGLMVGDYVSIVPSGLSIKIAAIHNKKVAYHSRITHLEWVRLSLLSPIPLTPKILEKNGFIKASMINDTPPYDKDEEGNMHFSLNEKFWGWWQPNNTFLIPANGLGWLEFKYVHELQHILKLIGIEQEIVL